MELNVLLVEDDAAALEQLKRDLPGVFLENGVTARIEAIADFEEAYQAAANPHVRYDLVITDTYRGNHKSGDVAVTKMIDNYRAGRFAPIVVYSSASKPDGLSASAFVAWADKATQGDIERAIKETLTIGIPLIARRLHNEIDRVAGKYLWEFLEKNWDALGGALKVTSAQLERLIRRRAALQISDLIPGSDASVALEIRYGLERYVYPALDQNYYNLGDIIRDKVTNEISVVLTPHCHLVTTATRLEPKADYVLSVKTVAAATVIGAEKLRNTAGLPAEQRNKKLSQWARNIEAKPEGRYWYLPKFLAIPHSYCDLLQVASAPHKDLQARFDRLATLTPPYAEALQESFSSFYGSVGTPDIDPKSIQDLLP
jgi:hypothetical protein